MKNFSILTDYDTKDLYVQYSTSDVNDKYTFLTVKLKKIEKLADKFRKVISNIGFDNLVVEKIVYYSGVCKFKYFCGTPFKHQITFACGHEIAKYDLEFLWEINEQLIEGRLFNPHFGVAPKIFTEGREFKIPIISNNFLQHQPFTNRFVFLKLDQIIFSLDERYSVGKPKWLDQNYIEWASF
tara:strand:- start:18108 stop:18656 length:549 start_codon:yes stop_codon:yes gene_type:complete